MSLTPDDSDVEVAAMSCMEIDSDDESDDDIPYRTKIGRTKVPKI